MLATFFSYITAPQESRCVGGSNKYASDSYSLGSWGTQEGGVKTIVSDCDDFLNWIDSLGPTSQIACTCNSVSVAKGERRSGSRDEVRLEQSREGELRKEKR